MNAPPTVSEEDITEAAAPFFNIIEEDDVENDIDIDIAKLNYLSVIMLLIFILFIMFVFFIKDTVILHSIITHLLFVIFSDIK